MNISNQDSLALLSYSVWLLIMSDVEEKKAVARKLCKACVQHHPCQVNEYVNMFETKGEKMRSYGKKNNEIRFCFYHFVAKKLNYMSRDEIPSCIVDVIRSMFPNPPNVPYVGYIPAEMENDEQEWTM